MMDQGFVPIVQSMASAATAPGRLGLPVCLHSEPYPTVEGSHDPETVAMLKQDYAGAAGELTAITQYVFQSARIANDETLANAMLQIAIVEMTHLDMLGDAIVTLGGSPSFDDGHYYWNASKVNYADSRRGMIEANIKSETTAIENYEKHAAATTNETVRAFLLRIAQDERLHLKFFTDMLAMTP